MYVHLECKKYIVSPWTHAFSTLRKTEFVKDKQFINEKKNTA